MINVWFSYMKEHLRKGILYAVCIGIFAGVFYLYNLPAEPVYYACLLTAVWIILYSIADFIQYYRNYAALRDATRRIATQWEEMPVSRNRIEAEYQNMVRDLYDCKVELESKSNIVRQEMLDYYSLWAHQIKTPIAAMRVLLQSERDDLGNQIYTKELSLELFKIEQYVEMVLSYLRMEEMSSDLVLQWYQLDDIVKQAVRKYSQMFILQKIKLNFDNLDTMVLTDEKWLVFVLEQLLSNALKYTKKGSISIYMNPDKKKTLVIEDTGIGIWEEDLPRVFEKGFTGYNGRTDKKSTGIGLYLCKSVITKLNHSIEIESEVGKGTKVSIHLGREELRTE